MSSADSPPPASDVPVLTEPAEGVPDVIQSERALVAAAEAIAEGTGPVALDAERAGGFRYGNRAYLVQLRREGSGSFLFDPIAVPDLSPIQTAIGDAEWVLHAATQDLPCLAELGLHPTALFDTELGARLAGLPRVGLAAVVENYLGISLAKEHSAVDWSTRPLPEPWLTYAALDVELLVQVRDAMYADLAGQQKLELALQDFAALTHFTGPPVRTDPWRRTSGMHKIRDRRAIARVRELWLTRDRIAAANDTAPGRVLPDYLIVVLANLAPTTPEALRAAGASERPASRSRARIAHRGIERHAEEWLSAIRRVNELTDRQLPPATVRNDSPPPPRVWADRDPMASARLTYVREQLTELSEQRTIPLENLITPDTLRRALWGAPKTLDESVIRTQLSDLGARQWQQDIVTPLILEAPTTAPVTDE